MRRCCVPRPAATCWPCTKTSSNEFGRLPLLVTRTFGAGKVLFMGTDGAWRWRKGVEDKYHYRFWGQVVRWMAYQRNMAKGETMRLYYVPDQPQLNQMLALHANVMERERRAAAWRRGDRADHGPVGPVRAGAVQLGRRRMGRIHRPVHGDRSRAATGSRSFASRPARRSRRRSSCRGRPPSKSAGRRGRR